MKEKTGFLMKVTIMCTVALAFCMTGAGFAQADNPSLVKEGVQVGPKVRVDKKTATEISYALQAGKVVGDVLHIYTFVEMGMSLNNQISIQK